MFHRRLFQGAVKLKTDSLNEVNKNMCFKLSDMKKNGIIFCCWNCACERNNRYIYSCNY